MYWALSTRQKFWFEISEIPRVQWNGTFRFHRPDPGHRTFGYCSIVLIQKSGTGDNNFVKWKGMFRSDRPTEMSAPPSNKRWSQIFRSDWIEMVPGSYLGFIVWGRSPESPRVSWRNPGAFLPRKFFEMDMRWDPIWCILKHNFEKCYRGILFYFWDMIMFLVI